MSSLRKQSAPCGSRSFQERGSATMAEADVWLELNIRMISWIIGYEPSPSQIRSQASLFHLTPQRSKPNEGFKGPLGQIDGNGCMQSVAWTLVEC